MLSHPVTFPGPTPQRGFESPVNWYADLAPARLAAEGGIGGQFLIRRFTDISGVIEQPALDAHVVAMHLGGPKRVTRKRPTAVKTEHVALGSLTLMPAFQANRWNTEGPIDFAHLTISPGAAEQIVLEEFDREPCTHHPYEAIGLRDPLLEQLFLAVLEQVERKSPSRLYIDELLTVFAVSLMERHSTLKVSSTVQASVARRGGLAGWQLRRIVDYMHAHLHEEIVLGDLAKIVGLSRAHFFRAFRQSMGQSPGDCLSSLRMRRAMVMLANAAEPAEVASALGFGHTRHFASAFKARTGVSPRLFAVSGVAAPGWKAFQAQSS